VKYLEGLLSIERGCEVLGGATENKEGITRGSEISRGTVGY